MQPFQESRTDRTVFGPIHAGNQSFGSRWFRIDRAHGHYNVVIYGAGLQDRSSFGSFEAASRALIARMTAWTNTRNLEA